MLVSPKTSAFHTVCSCCVNTTILYIRFLHNKMLHFEHFIIYLGIWMHLCFHNKNKLRRKQIHNQSPFETVVLHQGSACIIYSTDLFEYINISHVLFLILIVHEYTARFALVQHKSCTLEHTEYCTHSPSWKNRLLI